MPQTIYMVTEGSYSDYHMVAAFSSKKLAGRFIEVSEKENNPYQNWRIELLELDAAVPWINQELKLFSAWVYIDKENISAEMHSWTGDSDNSDINMGPISSLKSSNPYVYYRVFARNEEHVIKIVADRYYQDKAEGKFDLEQTNG
jgi:hypothetical protein